MNERIRVSDADREHVAERLREHFAQGRLSSEELDERLSAALAAKTVGDLRLVMADLLEPEPIAGTVVGPGSWGPRRAPGPGYVMRRGPRLFPLAFLALIAALVIPGAGWFFFAFFQAILLLVLIAGLTGIFAAARFRRHVRRHWQSGGGPYWQQYQWHG